MRSEPEKATQERRRVLILFGTRPEIIKLAPVYHALAKRADRFDPICVASGQHAHLLGPFAELLEVPLHRDLAVGQPNQSPNQVLARLLPRLESLLAETRPALVLVQGDTTTALAGALAAHHAAIPVGHVEAGLRSGDPMSPFPEEMNRRLIGQLARHHFAATARNAQTLRDEGVAEDSIHRTGNPVVDAVQWAVRQPLRSERLRSILEEVGARKLLVLTTHRRESFAEALVPRLHAVRRFVERYPDVAVVFPVHPNPHVVQHTEAVLGGVPRVQLVPPLDYLEFVQLLSHAWVIVSDSGGVQEEAPSLGKPLLVIRENTERPEALESGVAQLVPDPHQGLEVALEKTYADPTWTRHVRQTENPFGQGDAGEQIARVLERVASPARA
ncbi:MAG: UDP-N-acetylglucosamine 2-epimerase (non-hydrolyzing) [Proteobacteria bacterium]|nr:UDP-N-acetylglucosamine 2-epimerase (non-hydrolyzing) [Pseudomonadota bacterium]